MTTAQIDPTRLAEACGEDPSWPCERMLEWTDNTTAAEVADWVVAKPLAIAAIVLGAFVVSRVLGWVMKRTMTRLLTPGSQKRLERLRDKTPNVFLRTTSQWSVRSEARTKTLVAVTRSITSMAVWFVAVVWILEVLEINLGPLIAGAGIAGVALGFGAQNIVRDFLAGFFMIFEDQFGVGDIINVGDAQGTVEKLTLRSTRLRDVHGVVWHFPNGEIRRVANHSQEWARALLDVEVAYDTDLVRAQEVIQATAEALAADPTWAFDILETPEVWGVEGFTPNAVLIRLVVKTRPASQFRVLRALRLKLKQEFDKAGIEIPFAQVDIRVHNEGGNLDLSPEDAPDGADQGADPTDGSDGSPDEGRSG